jgi:hypothetical protein
MGEDPQMGRCAGEAMIERTAYRKYKRMYAVSCKGIGLIPGTLAYSRRDAISFFQGGGTISAEWEGSKRAGYRTVQAMVRVVKP